jgi:hypothetical protein
MFGKTLKPVSRLPLITIAAIGLLVITVSSNLHWGQDHWKNLIEADAKGYYAYLPATFIYHDLNFGFYDKIEKEKYFSSQLLYDYRSFANGQVINKYFCGTAVCQLPFFAIAHLLSTVTGYDTDGYSKIYLVMINVAAIFYLLSGLWFANKLLELYNIGPLIRAITLFSITTGTNLFFYVIGECGMSHVYSFAMVSMFAYFSRKYFTEGNLFHFNLAAITLGLIVLIRPVNGIVLFSWPFLAGNPETLLTGIGNALKKPFRILPGIALAIAIPAVQLLIYKLSTGSYFVYSYINEGFNFTTPHIIDFLISYKKGMFVYTPMLAVALAGSIVIFRKSSYEFYCFLFFVFFVIYILSSWWNWWYGGSFSSRVMIEFYPFFIIAMALLIQTTLNGIRRKLLITLIVLLVIVCQIQTYQYRYNHIHWENMNKEKYWEVFLRVDRF